ncbi:MAG: hypothetical protein FJX20_02145 [Alphaproteobacteria bacterium]|nr:hypothetical protein [Alphaproteobacteria bacterium]
MGIGDPDNKQQDYFAMAGLIRKHYEEECYDKDLVGFVPWETVAAIFWEETQFSNIRQTKFNHADWLKGPSTETESRGNHAVGFGQVERETIILMQTQVGKTGTLKGFFDGTPLAGQPVDQLPKGWWRDVDAYVLGDTRRAIHLTWHALLHQRKRHPDANLEQLLHNYGGLRDKDGKPTPKMRRVARGWLTTTKLLQCFRRSGLGAGDYGGMMRAKRVLAAIFSCSRRSATFMPSFGVEARPIAGYIYAAHDLYALGDGLGCVSFGSTFQPGGNGAIDADYRAFIAEYKSQPEGDHKWIRPWIHDRYPSLKGRNLEIGPKPDE